MPKENLVIMSYDKVIEFTDAVRGHHYYRRFWKPEP